MNCKQCSADLSDKPSKSVAHWVFCVPCFEQLMQPKAAAVEPPAPAISPARPPEAKPAARPAVPPAPTRNAIRFSVAAAPTAEAFEVCKICRVELEAATAVDLGFWKVCESCYQSLNAPRLEGTEAEPVDEAEQARLAEQAAEEEAADRAHLASLRASIFCDGCGRTVKLGGTKAWQSAGTTERLCPDCNQRRIRAEAQGLLARTTAAPVPGGTDVGGASNLDAPSEASAAPSQADHAGDRWAQCESCERPLNNGPFEYVDGYAICNACMHADPDLAVDVARTRHRKHLQSLRDELS